MNTVVLVGRLAQDPEVRTTETGKNIVRISLAVNRGFKNPDGIYETDFIDCTLWDGLAKNIGEYCKKGDTVGVKGRIQVSHYEVDNQKKKKVDVIVEKLSFLGSKTQYEKEELIDDTDIPKVSSKSKKEKNSQEK